MRMWFSVVFSVLTLGAGPIFAQGLQSALDDLGYSVNVVTDLIPHEVFFQQQQDNASIIFQESSYYLTEAVGYYTESDLGQWLVGGASTTLPLSTSLPVLDGTFGFKFQTSYTGSGSQEGTWFSETARNSDGFDHLWVFPTEISGETIPNSYLLAWEDLSGLGDHDFQDMVVRVDGVEVVEAPPAPGAQLINLSQWRAEDGGNDHWYAILAVPLLWQGATNMAATLERDGELGHLATISSEEENNFVFNTVTAGVISPSILDEYFLGGMWNGDYWSWATGEPFVYANWAPGEPSSGEPAVAMWGRGEPNSGRWNNEDADRYTFWSIVEWGLDAPPALGSELINLTQWRTEDGGNDHWYAILAMPLFWASAIEVAASLEQEGEAGYLATITSGNENDFIFNTVTSGVVSPAIEDEYFLGGQWNGVSWSWMTGEPLVYSNWGPGEPNSGEPAIALWGQNGTYPGTWNNEDADQFLFWSIVEWGPHTGQPPVPENHLVNLSKWPIEDGGNDHWYAVLAEPLLWQDANQLATTLKQDGVWAHLATITSPQENDFISTTILDGVISPSIIQEYFLGGYLVGGTWNWITDEPFVYTNWDAGEPTPNEPAVAVYGQGATRAGKWNNEDADIYTFWSIVEWELSSAPGTMASLSGTVSAASVGLEGVMIELSSLNSNTPTVATTDYLGRYEFSDLPNGSYDLDVRLPLGFLPVSEPLITVEVTGADEKADFELGQTSDVSSFTWPIWWWKKRVDEISKGEWSRGVTRDEINSVLQAAFDHFYSRGDDFAIQIPDVTFVGSPARAIGFDDLYGIFFPPTYDGSYPAKARRGLLTMVLALASGHMSQLQVVSEDGATSGQSLTYFVGRYLSGGSDAYYETYYYLKKVWMGQTVPAGIIPVVTPNIMFKPENAADEILPIEFSLGQNHPNPFNPTTEIEFAVRSSTGVRLEVFNILGRRVATLVDGPLDAGCHTVVWDAGTVASGVYFYRLQAGKFVDTKKMVLLK